jgi:carbamoyl-phosphate synthase small subunit
LKALLALEDGLVLWGRSFTGSGEARGEVVFNTAMTGYQEILTDPSYKGQIVTMTYPLMGNYGINPDDIESCLVQVEGFIVKEYHAHPSNWRSRGTLAAYLQANGKLGVEGLDTRAVTKRLREVGAMRGIISTEDLDPQRLVRRVRDEVPDMNGLDLVPLVTCPAPYWWDEGIGRGGEGAQTRLQSSPEPSPPTPYRGMGGVFEGRAGDSQSPGPPLNSTFPPNFPRPWNKYVIFFQLDLR